MPDTYHIKLSDGREFNVMTEGGPPSESDVLSHLPTEAASAHAPFPPRGWQPAGTLEGTSDAPPSGAPDWKANLAAAMESTAHPKSVADLLPLLIPSGGAQAVGKLLSPVKDAVGKYGGAAAKLAGTAATALLPPAMVTPARAAAKVLGELAPSEMNSPLTVAGREGRAHAAVADMVDRYKPNTGGLPAVANPTVAPAAIPYARPTVAAALSGPESLQAVRNGTMSFKEFEALSGKPTKTVAEAVNATVEAAKAAKVKLTLAESLEASKLYLGGLGKDEAIATVIGKR